jgi:hypothetical protein
MTDYARMRRHFWYRKIAIGVLLLCFLLGAGEIYETVKYHFPWWADFGDAITFITALGARFVMKKTEMYSGLEE